MMGLVSFSSSLGASQPQKMQVLLLVGQDNTPVMRPASVGVAGRGWLRLYNCVVQYQKESLGFHAKLTLPRLLSG